MWSTTARFGFGSPDLILYHKLFYWTEAVPIFLGASSTFAFAGTLFAFFLLGFGVTCRAVRLAIGQRSTAIESACAFAAIGANFATTEWLIRGDVSELAAQLLLPLVFAWCIRLIRTGTFAIRIGPVMALVFLAHSGIALSCAIPLLIGVAIAALRHPRRIGAWIAPCFASLAMFVALLLPVLLPSLRMLPYASLDLLRLNAPRITHRPIASYLPDPAALLRLDPSHPFALDVMPVLGSLAMLTLLLPRSLRPHSPVPHRTSIAAFLAFVLAAMLAPQTRAALPVFDLPLLDSMQFSWRLLPFVTVALSLGSAIALDAIARSCARRLLTSACLLLVLATVLTKLAPPAPDLARLSARAIDHADLGDGEAPEYEPRVAGVSLSAQIEAVDRVVATPLRCRVRPLADPSLRERRRNDFEIDCPSAGPTRLPLFLGPGMRFAVDGVPRKLRPTCLDPRPLLDLPAGRSMVTVRFPTWWSTVAGGWRPPRCADR